MSDKKEIQEILELLEDEPESQPEKIAIDLGIPVEEVSRVIEEHRPSDKPNSKLDILEEQLEMLRKLYEIAQFEYENVPNDKNALAVTSLMNTAQSVIKDIEEFRDNTSLMKSLLQEVIQPFVKDLIKAVTENARNLRSTLVEEIPESKQTINRAVDEFVEAYGVSSQRGYERLVDRTSEVLNVSKSKSKSNAKEKQD